MSLFQPSNQIKLTNVAVVRLKKGGKRFELACYNNKVMEWRNAVETDLDEVLQIEEVFTNVSKGEVSKKEDIKKCFNTDDKMKVIKEILKKGELQKGEKERQHQSTNLLKDIINNVSEMTINPRNNRPYPITLIEKALKEVNFNVNPNKNAKQQALEAIKLLQSSEILPITRAQIRARILIPSNSFKSIEPKLKSLVTSIEETKMGKPVEIVALFNPGNLNTLTQLINEETDDAGEVTVLDLRNVEEGDKML